jgi:hypothetical protein
MVTMADGQRRRSCSAAVIWCSFVSKSASWRRIRRHCAPLSRQGFAARLAAPHPLIRAIGLGDSEGREAAGEHL